MKMTLNVLRRYSDQSGFYLVSIILTVLYLLSLWPQNSGIKHLDSYEFLAQAEQLGVCHPPGYSLFTLLGHVFILVGSQVGVSSDWSLVYGLYLLSLLSLLGLTWIVWRATKSLSISLFFGISLIQCRVFQFASNTIEVYGLIAFLFTLLLISIQWQQIPWLKYLVGGFLISHHTTSGPVVLLILLFHRDSRLACFRWFPLILIGPIFHFLYLTLRSHSHLNYWFDFNLPAEHWYHFSAKLYSVFLGIPNASSIDKNIEAIIQNFPTWHWVATITILIIWSVKKIANPLIKSSNTYCRSVNWMPSFSILITACLFELVRNLCYHISDIYSHKMLFSIFFLFVIAKLLNQLSVSIRAICLIVTIFCFLLFPKIYDRVDEVVDLQRLAIDDAEILFPNSSKSIFVANAVSMFPMLKFASKNPEIAHRLIPDWTFVFKGSYERVVKRLQENKLSLEFKSFPVKETRARTFPFFKEFLHLNKTYSDKLYLDALYASEPMLGSGKLELDFINRGMWNELVDTIDASQKENPVFVVISGYVDQSDRFQFTRYFEKGQIPVISLYLRNIRETDFQMEVELNGQINSKRVTFLKQPSHFHLNDLSEVLEGVATIRFIDPLTQQLYSEFQIEYRSLN